jgi:hypothetical protein
MTREPPSNGEARRRKPMPKRTPRETIGDWQLDLLLNADRVTRLDARNRALVVTLVARLLLEAAQRSGKAVVDDEA